jgi:hypothetical protein
MMFMDAVEICQGWPADRSAPRKLAAMINAAEGEDRVFMQQLVEALMVAAKTEADYDLIDKYLSD